MPHDRNCVFKVQALVAMVDAVAPFGSTAELLLSELKVGRTGWACLRPEEQPNMTDLQRVLSCSRTDAAFRKLLHVLKAPAEYHKVIPAFCVSLI
jgi:hypothetical protein